MRNAVFTTIGLASFALGLTISHLAGSQAAPPVVDSLVTHLVAAPDSSVRVGMRIWLQGGLLPGDTAVFRYYRNDTIQVYPVTKRKRALADTVQIGAPAYGKTAAYKGCGQIERGGRTSGVISPNKCWLWSYMRPPLGPPPVVDSVTIIRVVLLPPNGVVAFGESVQLCAFAVTQDGRKVKLKPSWNRAGCDAAYRTWVAAG